MIDFVAHGGSQQDGEGTSKRVNEERSEGKGCSPRHPQDLDEETNK